MNIALVAVGVCVVIMCASLFGMLVADGKRQEQENELDIERLNKLRYVQANMDKFGIRDAEGSSLDDREIHVISPDAIGVNPVSQQAETKAHSIKCDIVTNFESKSSRRAMQACICSNCGAPVNTQKRICEYCGVEYI
jgi:hypothetical protein